MGLDDFIDNDSSNDSSSSKSTSSSSSETNNTQSMSPDDMSFYGTGNELLDTNPLEREEAMSDYDMSDLAKTKDGTIKFDSDHVKLYAPVFYTFTSSTEYESGEYYQLVYTGDAHTTTWDGRVVTCIGSHETRLGNMSKEAAMFEVGTHKKSEAMSRMEDNLSQDIDADTTIHINFFGDAFMLRDLAQATNEFKEGDRINRDDVTSKVLRPNLLSNTVDDS